MYVYFIVQTKSIDTLCILVKLEGYVLFKFVSLRQSGNSGGGDRYWGDKRTLFSTFASGLKK